MVKFKLKQNDTCPFCSLESQDRVHLFYGCFKVKEFWKNVQENYVQIMGSTQISELEGLTGFSLDHNGDTLRNFIILCARKLIYDSNMHGRVLDASILYSQVDSYRKIEYKIAEDKFKLGNHLKKWQQIE